MDVPATLVIVTPPEPLKQGPQGLIGSQLWVAAIDDPDEAVSAVLKRFPAGWAANIAKNQLRETKKILDLRPGDVSELSQAPKRR